VNRLAGELGFCRTGDRPVISSYHPHFGEEAPLVGRCGSGTIFVTNCNLGCVFCQNYEISHLGQGVAVSCEALAEMMLELQARGCHNINIVTPTHIVPFILAALEVAAGEGLRVPLVYNCSGYEALSTLELLEGVVDIYMPDVKFAESSKAERYARAGNYFAVVREALVEMQRQVGELVVDEKGIARRGLLVRHLVMPGDLAGTERILRFLAESIPLNTYLNIMPQYRPCGRAYLYPEINRPLSHQEYQAALKLAYEMGFSRLD